MNRHDPDLGGAASPRAPAPAEHPRPAEVAELLTRLSAEQRRTHLHALICPLCRQLLLDLALQDETVAVEADAPGSRLAASVWDLVGAVQERQARHLDEDESRADALCGQLLSMPAAERGLRVETDPRFASPGVARRLLAASAEIARLQPDAAARLALAALDVAERLDAQRFTESPWAEARLDHECNRHAVAIEKLQLVVAGFIIEEPYDAAAALVDLWRILLATGRRSELPALREAVDALLRRAEIHPRALSVLDFVTSAAAGRGPDQDGLLERAALYLARARHDPELPFEPLDEQPLRPPELAAPAAAPPSSQASRRR